MNIEKEDYDILMLNAKLILDTCYGFHTNGRVVDNLLRIERLAKNTIEVLERSRLKP